MTNFRRGVTVLGIGAVLFFVAGAVSASADPSKPYSAVLTAGAGANGLTVTAVLTNENTTQRLGSADLTPPPGYTITGGSVSPGTLSVSGNVVDLRNLDLAPGQSATATIEIASSPCSAGTWSVEAKQANDFSGLPGNDLTLDTAHSNLVTSLCGAPCKQNSACGTTDAGNANGSTQVTTGKGKLSGQLVESANPDNLSSLEAECKTVSGYQMADPNSYTILAPPDRSKVATITFTSATMLTLGSQQICFDAPYPFTAVTVTGSTVPATNVGTALNPDYVGLLPDCVKGTTGPCHNRKQDQEFPAGGGFDIVLVADIPPAAGDPRCG